MKCIAARAGSFRSTGALLCPQIMQPLADVYIAQAARTLLDVGLEMEQRIAVLRMALAGKLRQRDSNRLAIARAHLRHSLVAQLCKDSVIAANPAQIQQGQRKLGIRRIQALALSRRERRERDLQPAGP